jgi:hypothetical protein
MWHCPMCYCYPIWYPMFLPSCCLLNTKYYLDTHISLLYRTILGIFVAMNLGTSFSSHQPFGFPPRGRKRKLSFIFDDILWSDESPSLPPPRYYYL